MTIFLVILALISIGFIAYGLFSPLPTARPKRPKKKPLAAEERVYPESEVGLKEQKILKLEKEIGGLRGELEKAKADYQKMQNVEETLKQKEANFKEELAKREEWLAKNEADLKKIKEQDLGWEKKIQEKERQLQEEFSKNVNLSRELEELNAKNKVLDKENKDKFDEIEAMRHKINQLLQENQMHLATVAELKKQAETKEWVSKEEFQRLNEEYTELEKDLEIQEEKLRKQNEEIIRLKNLLKDKELPDKEQSSPPI